MGLCPRHHKAVRRNISRPACKKIDIITARINSEHLYEPGCPFRHVSAHACNRHLSRKTVRAADLVSHDTIYTNGAVRANKNIARLLVKRCDKNIRAIFYHYGTGRHDGDAGRFLIIADTNRFYGNSIAGYDPQCFPAKIKNGLPRVRSSARLAVRKKRTEIGVSRAHRYHRIKIDDDVLVYHDGHRISPRITLAGNTCLSYRDIIVRDVTFFILTRQKNNRPVRGAIAAPSRCLVSARTHLRCSMRSRTHRNRLPACDVNTIYRE